MRINETFWTILFIVLVSWALWTLIEKLVIQYREEDRYTKTDWSRPKAPTLTEWAREHPRPTRTPITSQAFRHLYREVLTGKMTARRASKHLYQTEEEL